MKNGTNGCGGCTGKEGGCCRKKTAPLPIPGALEASVGSVRWFRPTTVEVSGSVSLHRDRINDFVCVC